MMYNTKIELSYNTCEHLTTEALVEPQVSKLFEKYCYPLVGAKAWAVSTNLVIGQA